MFALWGWSDCHSSLTPSEPCAVPDVELAPSLAASKQAGSHPSTSRDNGKEQAGAQQTFRDYYVKTFSSAFASELFDLQQVHSTSPAGVLPVLWPF